MEAPIKDVELILCPSGVHRLNVLRGDLWERVGYISEDAVADVVRFMIYQIGAVKKQLQRGNIEGAKRELYI